MKDLKLFGTEAYPIHPSAMYSLIICPWRAAMFYLFDPHDEGGPAGDTGSATHVAVASFHRGKELASCLEDMRTRSNEYPQADLQDAASMFLAYAHDTRNHVSAALIEHKIAFSIQAAADDPTGAPIQVVGRLDKVRVQDGKNFLDDLKTTKKDPLEQMGVNTFQIAAYCVGASIVLQQPVHPGALIFPRRYKSNYSTDPVHYHYPWRFKDCERVLYAVRSAVARVRRGELFHVPNPDCFWCPGHSPDLCFPRLQETLEMLNAEPRSS